MSSPEPLSDAAVEAPPQPASPSAQQAPTCFEALRALCAGGNENMSSTPQAAAVPAAKADTGGGRAAPADAAGGAVEPLSPRARETLRSTFLAGASPQHVNDVYALGDTIGAAVLPADPVARARSRVRLPGTGGFAVVLRATHRVTRAEVAVKVMSLSTSRIADEEVRPSSGVYAASLRGGLTCAGTGGRADDTGRGPVAALRRNARGRRRRRHQGGGAAEKHRPVRARAGGSKAPMLTRRHDRGIAALRFSSFTSTSSPQVRDYACRQQPTHARLSALTALLCAGRSGRRCFVVTELLRGGELLEALLERGAYSERDARTIFGTVRPPSRLACVSGGLGRLSLWC